MTKILFLFLTFNLYAQTYKFERSLKLTAKGWIEKKEFGTIRMTFDSVIILSNKNLKILTFKRKIVLGEKDTVYICSKTARVRIVKKPEGLELQTMGENLFDKYFLNKYP